MNKLFWRGLLRLIRPYWWGKTLFAFTLGAAMAVNGVPHLGIFLLGFIIIAPLLYGGLYTLNDLSDTKLDKLDAEKKKTAFVSGMVSTTKGSIFALILLAVSLIGGFLINKNFFYVLVFMLLNQSIYSFGPRLKERPFFDVLSTGFISPILKFSAGWFLFTNSLYLPILALAGICFTQSGGYLFYKLHKLKYNNPQELAKKQNSTVALLPDNATRSLATISLIIGFVAFIILTLNSLIALQLKFLGVLPLGFSWLVLACIIIAPPMWYKFQSKKKVFSFQSVMYIIYFILSLLILVIYWI